MAVGFDFVRFVATVVIAVAKISWRDANVSVRTASLDAATLDRQPGTSGIIFVMNRLVMAVVVTVAQLA
jgi:hypothetical protein